MSPRVWLALAVAALAAVAGVGVVPAAGAANGGKDKDKELVKATAEFAPERVSHRSLTREEAIATGIPERDVPDESIFAGRALTVGAAGGGCWQQTWHHHAGLWPYDRHIWQQTTWCGNGSMITSRSSVDWPGTGPACYTNWGPDTWRAGGGAGYSSVDVTTRGGFSCNVALLGNLQFWLWMTIRYYPWGGSAAAGYGY